MRRLPPEVPYGSLFVKLTPGIWFSALEHALARSLRFQVLAGQRDARLRRGLLADDADVADAGGASPPLRSCLFDRFGAGRLRECVLREPAPTSSGRGKRHLVESEQHCSVGITHVESPVIVRGHLGGLRVLWSTR